MISTISLRERQYRGDMPGWQKTLEKSELLHMERHGAHVVGIVSGWGSWGNGENAAAWNRHALLQHWQTLDQTSGQTLGQVSGLYGPAACLDALLSCIQQTPSEITSPDACDEFGWSFSACLAHINPKGTALHLIAVGLLAVYLYRRGTWIPLYTPKRIMDDPPAHLAHIYAGPLWGEGWPDVNIQRDDLYRDLIKKHDLQTGDLLLMLDMRDESMLLHAPSSIMQDVWRNPSAMHLSDWFYQQSCAQSSTQNPNISQPVWTSPVVLVKV